MTTVCLLLFPTEIFEYLKNKQTPTVSKQRTSNFRYVDQKLVEANEAPQSKNFFTKFDQWLDFLRDPYLDISIRHVDLHYTTA